MYQKAESYQVQITENNTRVEGFLITIMKEKIGKNNTTNSSLTYKIIYDCLA